MPAGREGKRGERFSFALPRMNFHGLGGRGGQGPGGSLPSAAALLIYACQRVGRTNGLNSFLRFHRSIFPEGGALFSGRCLQ